MHNILWFTYPICVPCALAKVEDIKTHIFVRKSVRLSVYHKTLILWNAKLTETRIFIFILLK